jgi:hypothetical protein
VSEGHLLELRNYRNWIAQPRQIWSPLNPSMPQHRKLFGSPNVINWIWSEGLFPSNWGEAIVVPISKAGKDHSHSSSYRPICLTSCVCKLLKRTVNSRLVWILESQGLLSNYQCSFHCSRSSVDHLITLEEQARQAFFIKQHLVGIFFDIEKVCDTALQYRILWTLDHWKLKEQLQIILCKFMSGRRF